MDSNDYHHLNRIIHGFRHQKMDLASHKYLLVRVFYLLNDISSLYLIQIHYQFMQIKPSQSQLKSRLHSQRINSTSIFYSIVKKQAKTFSMFTNERLLIYDNTRRILFYNNDFKNIPFAPNLPHPKNDVASPIATCTFKNPNGTNQIQVRHTGKNAKGEMETVQWNFVCQIAQLTKEWMGLLQEEKNRIVSQATGQKGAGFIHDTLMEALRKSSPPKETILKSEEQLIKTVPQQEQPSRNSSYIEQPSYVLPQQENSRISIKRLDVSQQREPELQESNGDLPLLGSRSVIRTKTQMNRESQALMEVSQVRRFDSNSNIRGTGIHGQQGNSSVKYSVNDWNMKFLRNPHETTIIEFQHAANNAFSAIGSKDTPQKGSLRQHQHQGLSIKTANLNTEEARTLKREFRNYHFIMESCKTKLVVGVPLCCLIQWQGVVALVKAPLPRNCQKVTLAKVINQVRDLERYTRVGNAVLDLATLVDATEVYGVNGDQKLIYLDDLVEYLPQHADQDLVTTSLRPEFMLDAVTQVVPGGQVKPNSREFKTLLSACQGLTPCIRQLAAHLNSQQILWAEGLDLKQLFHSFGVNMKLLPRVYSELTNKQVKRQLMSVMAAKVAKELMGQVFMEAFKDGQEKNRIRMVEDCLRNFVQGNTTSSSEFWKDLSTSFKKQYGIPLNNSEVMGGFFLNSIIKYLRINCDLSKLNKSKRIFKEQGIIQSGFVMGIQSKPKSYYRFSTEMQEKVRFAMGEEKKDESLYDQLVQELKLENGSLPLQFSQGAAKECLLQFLSFYTPPKALDPNAPLRSIPIYASIFHEPPSGFTLRLTRAYLQWSIKKDCSQQFKKGIENALKIADYWLQETHLHHAALYQLLSDFYAAGGNAEQSVNFMKEALSRSIRAAGAQSKVTGSKYYELGQRELKAGHKREALENFNKARQNMEANKNKTIKYPQLLLRLASLHLNSGNIEACVEGCLQAVRQFEEYDKDTASGGVLTESLKIKTFQVLSRAYQISGKRQQTRDMASLCAKKFNRCKSSWAFEQMLRICLAAVIFRFPMEKGTTFVQLVHRLQSEQRIPAETALRELMSLAQNTIVMERFMSEYNHLDKATAEGTSKRTFTQDSKNFLKISSLLSAVVGVDFIEGLVHQKQYE